MNANRWLLCIVLFLSMVSGCTPAAQDAGLSSAPKAWFDAPLPGTVFYPPNPCSIVAHGASPNGIAVFELLINGQSASVPSPDTGASLVTLTRDCAVSEPGAYALQLRAQDNNGNWSGYAETYFVIPGAEGGTIGGMVIADLNGNGVQESNEVGAEGVEVVLKGCGSNQSQNTKPGGTFLFTNIPAGSCTLEVFKAGWGFSGSVPSVGYPIPVASDPNLPTNLGILISPMSDSIPPEPTSTVVPSVPDELSVTEVSTWVVYVGDSSCGPMETVVTARATASKGITAVILFYQFNDSEFQNVSMSPIGNNLYRGTISMPALFGDSIPFDRAIIGYQVVVQQSDGDTSLRTPVNPDIEALACGSSGGNPPGGQTDSCNAFTDQRTCIANNCNWWQINDTTFICQSKP